MLLAMSESNITSKPILLGKNYFLIGFMGTGKSHWGKLWAAANKLTFIDLDELIEQDEQTTIAEIFEVKGEAYFRNLEKEALRKCGDLQNTLIACGGGTPCFFENMQWMNEHGATIWIDEKIDILVSRLIREKSHRPLVSDLNENELKHFLSTQL